MSRRVVVGVAAVLGLSALTLGGLALAGSEPAPASAGGWTGWTGRVDPSAVADQAAMTPDDAVAVALLARSARAATRLAYAGRAQSTEGGSAAGSGGSGSSGSSGSTVTADLVHVPGRGTVVTAVSPTPAKPRLLPDGRSGTFVDDGRVLDLLRVHFRVLRQADLDTSVAGRPADAVVALTSDGAVAARFWLDHATGLLLRKQLLGSDGAVRRTSSFDAVRLGIPSTTSIPPTTSDAWGTVLDGAALTTQRSGGCPCPESLPGGLTLVETRVSTAGTVLPSPVVHQVFSDGLETVSLFSLAGTLTEADTDDLRGRGFAAEPAGAGTAWVRGATGTAGGASPWTAVWGTGSEVLTLVVSDAEDPGLTASAVLQALPPVPDRDASLWDRVLRGWDRLTGGRA